MMLDASVLQAPLLDHRGLDLAAARRVRYVLQQSFRYSYDEPVRSLRQRLVVVPPARHGHQYRRGHRLEVDGAAVRRRVRRDAHGNVVAWLQADHVPEAIEFRLAAVIERVRDDGPALVPAAALPRLLRPTPLTAPDERLRDLAAGLVCPDPEETAQRICDTVAAALTYESGVTSVRTTAAEALAGGRGVCQDFAHVMLAVCRIAGLPARYVSGHLLGQGGTHAWVEVLLTRSSPGGTARGSAARGGTACGGAACDAAAEAVAFDPCNGRRTDGGYVTIATGRDYADVAPVSGSYLGASPGRLTADRRVGVLAAA